MKKKLNRTLLLLSISALLTTSFVLAQRAEAKDRDSEHITFAEPTMVGGALLKADTYKVTWDGVGPQVQVTFTKGSKVLATTSATLVVESNPYDGAMEVKTMDDNSRVLERISWKKKALVFMQSS